MPDDFSNYGDSAAAPVRHATVLAPSDSTDRADTPKGIYVGTGGDVTLVAVGAPVGAAGVVFGNLPSGALLPSARRVTATGTTATDLVALV